MHLFITCLCFMSPGFVSEDTKPATSAKLSVSPDKMEISEAADPESTLRSFLIAQLRKDEKRLKALTRPNDEIQWLLQDKSDERAVEQLIPQIERVPIRWLKPGETVKRAGGRVETVEPGDVAGDRVVLMVGASSIFYHLRKIDGKWYVDPTRMITMRKSNDAILKRRDTRNQNPG